ncbi:hypothetical protein [Paenibacillus sp. GCM10027626]|uniref:hypothetical protein n=1 Tax=Paenibacillus sp. GCM10027626 TaxID=3273411 RepID=UPI003625146C
MEKRPARLQKHTHQCANGILEARLFRIFLGSGGPPVGTWNKNELVDPDTGFVGAA